MIGKLFPFPFAEFKKICIFADEEKSKSKKDK